ncbi:serine hydrolase domain-containing protein [Streptomyces sp. 6N223]|uniref:serine hydrolase domain-containing protein n=1 Tax=Streptomyces sp. 6N223 TaxID=3457412 RepID=UPI003FD4AAC6
MTLFDKWGGATPQNVVCWWNKGQQAAAMLGEKEIGIDLRVMDYMKRYDIPGLSLGITRDERLILAKGYGCKEEQLLPGRPNPSFFRLPVQPETPFRIASISKPITAVAVMTLIAAGRLGLNDRVFGPGRVLNRFHTPDPPAPPPPPHVRDITVRHLLEHTSGLGFIGNDDVMFLDSGGPQLSMTRDQLIQWVVSNTEPATQPGSTYRYSNFGYCVLGRIIEEVNQDRQSYEEYVLNNVLRPCGITDMRIGSSTPAGRVPGEAKYFPTETGTQQPCTPLMLNDPYRLNMLRMDAHGGWVASVIDLLRFAVKTDGLTAVADLLTRTDLDTMTTPSSTAPDYGLGWAIRREYEVGLKPFLKMRIRWSWGHLGTLPGTIGYLLIQDDGVSVAALANKRPGSNVSDLECYGGEFASMLRGIAQAVSKWKKWPAYDLFACY